MPPNDPNQIDVNLSLLPGESELAVNSLVAQLQAISAQLAVLQAPDSGAAARAQLTAFQQTGVPTHGVSATASRIILPAGIQATRAKEQRERADRVEEDRRRELETRREQAERAAEARSAAQAARDAERLAAEDRQNRLRQEQEERRQALVREEYGAARAEAALERTTVVRGGARYVFGGRAPDINRGLPEDERFTADEQRRAYEAIRPERQARGARGFFNRLLQTTTPEAARLPDEALRQRAEQRAQERLVAEEQERGRPIVVTTQGRPTQSQGGPSVPPGTRVGDDGFPEPGLPQAASADLQPGMPAWQRHISANFASAPMNMPRIGEFTAQDTLNMMAQFAGRRAYERYERNERGGMWGGAAAITARMGAAAPYLANARQNLGRRGFDTSQENLQRIAYLTGQASPETTIVDIPEIGPVAMQDPIAAARASVEGFRTLGRVGLEGTRGSYLRSGEAFALGGEMITRGFTEDATIEALRGPLGHIRGEAYRQLEPGAIIDAWQKAMYAGGESMSQFTQSMSSLVPAARAARMNVDEFNASADQFAETVQSMGGTYVGGRNAANAFALQTGMAPQVGAQLMQDPLIQGLTYGQTGILPQLQGMLGQGQRTQMGVNSLSMLVDMFSGGFQDQTVAVPGGQMTISARDQAVAMAGQQLGLDREAAERLLNQQEALETMTPVNQAYDAYMQDIEAARTEFGDGTPEFRAAVREINQGRGASGVSRRDMRRALRDAGFKNPRSIIGENTQGTAIGDAIADAQKKRWEGIFDKADSAGGEPNTRVQIELKGWAERAFKKVLKEGPANQNKDRQRKGFLGDPALRGIAPEDIREWASSG